MRGLLLTLLCLTPAVGETYLVCAGVEQYDDPGISPLKYAVADVRAVAAAFREAGVPDGNIALLTSDAADRRNLPTRANLLRALQAARSQTRANDTLLFFFSGHGMAKDGQTYLLTFDATADLLDQTALSMSVVNRALEGFQGANLLLVIDACRNDPDAGKAAASAALDESFAKGLRPRLQPRLEAAPEPNVALLLACEIGQRAWEMPEKGQGAFTWWLLQGLRSEAPRTAAGVPLDGLADYLSREVPAWAQRAGRRQTPRFEQVSGGPFQLPAPRPRPEPGTPTPPTGPAGPVVDIVRREGTLELTTRLPAVRLELDGQPAGEVAAGRPVRLTRLIGRVTVRGAAAGHVPLEVVAEVKPNQTTTVALDLPRLPGLVVTPDLPATVEVDGVVRGEAGPTQPLRLEDLSVGPHTVRVSAPGRAPAEQTVDLKPGATETVKLTPLAFPTLTIEVEEDGVEVLLDGQPVGTLSPATPAVVRNVTPGPHKLTARRGGESRETTVTLAPGTEQTALAWSAFRAPSYLKDFKPIAGLQYRVSPQDGMPQVLIPAGEFLMGSPASEPDRGPEEGPQKRVYVSAFWMDLHEVTVGQYKAFCAATKRPVDDGWRRCNTNDNHPVVVVSWDDAAAYAAWAGRQLPTEAQWEKAARGGKATAYPWGNEFDAAKANIGGGGTKPVGSYAPNGYGLYDMSGNVREWCRDWYDATWYARMPVRDPVNETRATSRVLRGGSWDYSPRDLRVAGRVRGAPDDRFTNHGFRCSEAP